MGKRRKVRTRAIIVDHALTERDIQRVIDAKAERIRQSGVLSGHLRIAASLNCQAKRAQSMAPTAKADSRKTR